MATPELAAMKISIIGIPWYTQRDWPRIREIMIDPDSLPPTYEKWLYRANKIVQNATHKGIVVYKVQIDPKAFPAWCRSRGLNIDGNARTEFADLHAIGMHREKH